MYSRVCRVLINESRMRWYEHMKKMNENRMAKSVFESELRVIGVSRMGTPRKK